MRVVLLILLSLANICLASVREVLTVYQALSFHGTDTAENMGEEIVQAGVLSTPMVLSGAMPEVLISAIAKPHKMPSIGDYPFEENNLLALCKIKLTGELKGKDLIVRFDLSEMTFPEEVELSARAVLTLAIKAVKKTLGMYYTDAHTKQAYRIVIDGTNEKNASLKDLSEKVTVKN